MLYTLLIPADLLRANEAATWEFAEANARLISLLCIFYSKNLCLFLIQSFILLYFISCLFTFSYKISRLDLYYINYTSYINGSYVIFFQKIKSAFTSNTYKLENGDTIEAALSQHFAYLHGVLQNMEAKLINQLHEQGNRLKNNLENIELQLRSQEEKLKFTMQVLLLEIKNYYRR